MICYLYAHTLSTHAELWILSAVLYAFLPTFLSRFCIISE